MIKKMLVIVIVVLSIFSCGNIATYCEIQNSTDKAITVSNFTGFVYNTSSFEIPPQSKISITSNSITRGETMGFEILKDGSSLSGYTNYIQDFTYVIINLHDDAYDVIGPNGTIINSKINYKQN